jgi:hypothetical protein
MIVTINSSQYNFKEIELSISNRNQENIFRKNTKRTLSYVLNKALNQPTNRLNKIASAHLERYSRYLDFTLGEFLYTLKENNNSDYLSYLNGYGDKRYCDLKLVSTMSNSKGLYCYIVDQKIQYIGRSKKTFGERIKEYGKITPYNCLIDGQNTNCKINSKINEISKVNIGLLEMNDSTDREIEELEKKIIRHLNFDLGLDLWNSQIN